jgi:maleylpyruvate isomerase
MTAKEWTNTGTDLFLGQLDTLAADEWDRPTALAGWTLRHLVAHVHYNAQALQRLVSWAATGEENRMYASIGQRAAEIEQGALATPQTLMKLVTESAAELEMALNALSATAWSAEVVTAQGRTVPATIIPWLRAREVMIHSVDLGTGIRFEDLPGDFVAALLVDVAKKRGSSPEAPALAAWLTGRADEAPTLGPWL